MRLFVSFDVPTEPLLKVQKKLFDGGLKITTQFHCTLKFLGRVDETLVPSLVERLRRVKIASFRVHFDRIGAFPRETSPRVLWVGLKPEEPLLALHRQIEDVFDGLFERDERFMPHVALARVKFLKDKSRFLRLFKELQVEPLEFSVNEFCLMKSELKRDGPVYSVMERFVLD